MHGLILGRLDRHHVQHLFRGHKRHVLSGTRAQMTLRVIYRISVPAIGAIEPNGAKCALAHGPYAGWRGYWSLLHHSKVQLDVLAELEWEQSPELAETSARLQFGMGDTWRAKHDCCSDLLTKPWGRSFRSGARIPDLAAQRY